MARVLALTNRKGGCGKTTTTVNLAAALAHLGFRVVVVDTDPQAHSTISFGISLQGLRADVAAVMLGSIGADAALVKTYVPRLMVIPASRALSDLERRYANVAEARFWLRDRLHMLHEQFDFVCLDTPPTTQLLTLNALIAAEEAFVPMQPQFLAMEGMVEIVELVEQVRRHYNPRLQVKGIIPTFYGRDTVAEDRVLEELRSQLGREMILTPIHQNPALAEAPGEGHTIFQHDLRGEGALDYYRLAQQILRLGSTRRTGSSSQ